MSVGVIWFSLADTGQPRSGALPARCISSFVSSSSSLLFLMLRRRRTVAVHRTAPSWRPFAAPFDVQDSAVRYQDWNASVGTVGQRSPREHRRRGLWLVCVRPQVSRYVHGTTAPRLRVRANRDRYQRRAATPPNTTVFAFASPDTSLPKFTVNSTAPKRLSSRPSACVIAAAAVVIVQYH